MKKTPSVALLAVVAIPFFASLSRADDWPQWRGPNRDGVWRETGILTAIPPSGLKMRWRARIGNGYSGPVVAQGRVYVTDHQMNPEVERVLCFDEATGKQLWVHSYPCPYEDMEYGNGPRASPTVHDGKVYTLGTKGHLFCLHALKGDVIWQKDLVKNWDGRVPRYGVSAAPLIEGDLLIVVAGGQPEACVVALDRNTGDERWKVLKDHPGYSAPIAITHGGCRQLIVWTAESIVSLAPATGKVYWQVPRRCNFDDAEVVASPVLHKDRLLCLAAWNRGSKMLKLDTDKPGVSVAWDTRQKPSTTISTPLFQDDAHFYAMENDGSLVCLDANTGKEVWNTAEATGGRYGTAHLTPNGDRVFLFDHRGHLILARLSPKGYEEIGQCLLVEPTAGYRAQGPVSWAHPAYANKCVFARNDRSLVCASLAAEQNVNSGPPPQAVKARSLDALGTRSILGIAFSPDGKTLAAGSGSEVKLLDLADNKIIPGPARHKDWVCSVAFSPDGKFLVSAGGNEFKPARNDFKTSGELKLWDVAARMEKALTGHTDKILSAAFSADSGTLVTGSADRTVRLWDVATGKEKLVLRGHGEAVWSVALSPDAQTIASASWDRTVKLWDAKTGQLRATLKGHEDEVLSLAFSPDGKTLASGSQDWTIRLWNVGTGQERATLKGHQGAVHCLAFTPDGKTLASGSGDETVKLWDPATGKERTTLRGHRSGVAAIAISRDGKALASGSMNDAPRLWDLTADK